MRRAPRFRPDPSYWQPEASESPEPNDILGPIPRACVLCRNSTFLRDAGFPSRPGPPGHGMRGKLRYWLPEFPGGKSLVPFPRATDVRHWRFSAAAMRNNPPDLAPCRYGDSLRPPTYIVSKADYRGC